MKYFRDDLWDKINSEIRAEQLAAEEEWDQNCKLYMKIFESLTNRISKKSFDILKNRSFHDFRLIELNVVHSEIGYRYPIKITIKLTNETETWEISFKRISSFTIDYRSNNDDFSVRRGLDDWGYEELLPVDEETLSFEVLFASGATILVHFANKNIFFRKL